MARRSSRRGAVLLTVFLAGAAAADDRSGWRRVTAPPEVDFPRDHGAHPEHRTEWWYFTGLLRDDAGRRLGYQFTIFRQGLAPEPASRDGSALRARQVVAGHLAVVDVDRAGFHHAERLRRVTEGLAGFSVEGLDLWLDDWQVQTLVDGSIELRAGDRGTGIAVDLRLRPVRSLVAHGDRGYSRKGADPGNASAYFSWTRLETEGELRISGRSSPVRGTSWFDHEWGTSQLGEGVVGWDWFSLRLGDGRDLMLYGLRRGDGTFDDFSAGTLVGTTGRATRLHRTDFEIESLDTWSSRVSGGVYPSRWRITVPDHGLDLEVQPLFAGAEVDGSRSTGVIYWEGPVELVGTTKGEGYVELTGYAGSLGGRF